MPTPLTSKAIRAIIKAYPDGVTAQQMVEYVTTNLGQKIALPTVRKYVQLGFLTRSTRRGLGYRQGSKGYYPASTLVQLIRVREQLRSGRTLQGLAASSFGVGNRLDDLVHRLSQATELMADHAGPKRSAQAKVARQKIQAATTAIEVQVEALKKIALSIDETAATAG